MSKKDDLSQEERDLFLRAFFGDSYVKHTKTLAPPSAAERPLQEVAPVGDEDDLKSANTESLEFEQAISDLSDVQIAVGLKEKQLALLKKNKQAKVKKASTFDASIDLHGMYREHARKRLELFIGRCVALGKKRILVIHGKGSGALREEVWQCLRHDNRVIWVQTAEKCYGGDGAVEALLRGNRI